MTTKTSLTAHLRRLLVPVIGLSLVAVAATAPVAAGPARPTHQQTPVGWHAQSGNAGAVGDDAVGHVVRRDNGISYRLRTTDLQPSHAYTVWLVIINNPEECADSPCTAGDIFTNPDVDAQVTFGAGHVVGNSGRAGFAGHQAAGTIEEGWIPDRGLDNPRGAEIHLTLNDHGPTIDGLVDEMIHTYRAGCTDDSLPTVFPDTARADGTPGPNTCQLHQSAVFPGR